MNDTTLHSLPLHLALRQELGMVSLLLEYGADPNLCKEEGGLSPIMLAASSNRNTNIVVRTDVIDLLLATNKIDLNYQDKGKF